MARHGKRRNKFPGKLSLAESVKPERDFPAASSRARSQSQTALYTRIAGGAPDICGPSQQRCDIAASISFTVHQIIFANHLTHQSQVYSRGYTGEESFRFCCDKLSQSASFSLSLSHIASRE